MSKHGQPDVFLLVDGTDLSGDTIELTPAEPEAILERTDGFGDSWIAQTFVGLKNGGGVTHRTYYDDALLASNATLVGLSGNSRTLVCGLEGNVKGKKAIAFSVVQTRTHRQTVRGELHKILAQYISNGIVDGPVILQHLNPETAAGVTSDGSTDNGAGTTNGGRAYVAIGNLTLGGYTNVIVSLQHSNDNGGTDPWTTLVALGTFTTGNQAAQVVMAAGTTIKRWTRITLTWTGAGSGQSVTVMAALPRD